MNYSLGSFGAFLLIVHDLILVSFVYPFSLTKIDLDIPDQKTPAIRTDGFIN